MPRPLCYIPEDSAVGCLQRMIKQNEARLKLERLRYALTLKQDQRAMEVYALVQAIYKRLIRREE